MPPILPTTIFRILVTILIILALAKLLIKKLPSIRGRFSEKKVSFILSLLPKSEYIVLNDLLFRNGNYTTQIDHIVLSVYGIFVIETKSYKGWIRGSANKDYWTQNIWGYKYSLYNPLFQNENHIKFLLRKFPQVSTECPIKPQSIVVFLNSSRVSVYGECENVVFLNELKSYIRSFSQEIISIEDCQYLATHLQAENLTDKTDREDHIRNVTSAQIYTESKIAQGRCPRCGGNLVRRQGKYGNFYGCSNYPRCKYTKSDSY